MTGLRGFTLDQLGQGRQLSAHGIGFAFGLRAFGAGFRFTGLCVGAGRFSRNQSSFTGGGLFYRLRFAFLRGFKLLFGCPQSGLRCGHRLLGLAGFFFAFAQGADGII